MAMNRKTSGLPSTSSSTSANNKQTTLFQNWSAAQNARQSQNVHQQGQAKPQDVQQMQGQQNELDDQLDEEILLAACEEWEMEKADNSSTTDPHPPLSTPLEDLPGFDVSAGHIYIYPVNYPVRDYQFNIVRQALFKNTLVTLPTGLGKTFIAAVVMYNFYRWYPRGKIVFMAPTKPLVFQQIEACFNIMGIPQEDMAEMTGNMHPSDRKKSWQRQRVFFLTPQVMTNDLSRRACPATDIKCVVVDEAHKALGNQAYCQVVRELSKYTSQFRVLALSATPGGDIKAVNEVLSNLLISHIEIRSEDSIDIRQYVHERKVDKIVVPLGDELKQVKDQYLQVMNVFVNRLVRCRVLFCRDPETLTKFQILKSREAFRQDPPPEITAARRGPVEGDFAICMSLYHGYELLLQHGQRSLYSFLLSIIYGSKGNSRTRSELMRNADLTNLMERLEGKYAGSMNQPNTSYDLSLKSNGHNTSGLFTSTVSSSSKATKSVITEGCKDEEDYIPSHPKMIKLKEIVLEHFEKFTSANLADEVPSTSKSPQCSTRVMIFAQYRDSVQEITHMLNRHWPTVRCMSFIGQASAGKNTKGFSQKEQIRVVSEFKSGGYNTLVSTCVGEEGLDIGDVDLIVCFDAHKSPIRLVQRMGRTGRKREGRIVMLVTEGKEAAIYDRSQYSKKGIHRALMGNSKSLHLYPCSPRMVPKGLNPTAHKMNITVGEYRSKHKTKTATSRTDTIKRKSIMDGDITGIMQGTKPDPVDEVFLTYEELAYWNLQYKVQLGEHVKAPQGNKFVCLNKQAVEEISSGNDKELSLNSFAEWQTNKQPVHKVSHSRRCAFFVEMMEFFDIQGHTEDEDIYGAEMALYLDEEDILKTEEMEKKGKEGIQRYCLQENKKNDKDMAVTDEEGDYNHKERVCKSNKRKKCQREECKVKSISSETGHLGSDHDLPVVDLFSEPSKRQDADSEKTEKHNSKTNMNMCRPSDNGRSNEGKVKKSGKKSKSPCEGIYKKPKRKSITIPCDSDGDDFACDSDNRSVTPPRLPSANRLHQPKLPDMEVQISDVGQDGLLDEPMDTTSDDNPSELPLKPCAAKNQQDGARIDTSLNSSDIFLSCSQALKAPEFPLNSATLRKDKSVSERARGNCEDDMLPPPPPSLCGLDLLEDIDLSFNASQLARKNTWKRSSPKEKPRRHETHVVPEEPFIASSERISNNRNQKWKGEEEEQNTLEEHVSNAVLIKKLQNENRADISSAMTHGRNYCMDIELDVIPDTDEMRRSIGNCSNSAGDDIQEVDNVLSSTEQGLITAEKNGGLGELAGLSKHKTMGDTEIQGKTTLRHTKAESVADGLVKACDSFEGNIFDDDDDKVLVASISSKHPVISSKGKPVAQSKGNVENSSINIKAFVADSKSTNKITGLKVSTASHSIKPCTNLVTPPKKLPKEAKLCTVTPERRVVSPCCDLEHEMRHTQQPKFELDFDFGGVFDMDDEAFDEIGIVPPSPQVSQKRLGSMALSQVSQSRIRSEIRASNHHTNAAAEPAVESVARVIDKHVHKLQDNPCSESLVGGIVELGHKNHVKHSSLDELEISKIESKTSTRSKFKHKLLHSDKPNNLQANRSMLQESKAQTSDDTCLKTVEEIRQPAAASTPVSSCIFKDKMRHLGSNASPTGQSDQRNVQQGETPSTHLRKAKAMSMRRSWLSLKRNGVGPKQSAITSTMSLPGKRKSSPQTDDGQVEDTLVVNPVKKPKTSSKQETRLSPENNEMYGMKQAAKLEVGKVASKDDSDLILEDFDGEDSFIADDMGTKPTKYNGAWKSKRNSTDTIKSEIGTDGDEDDGGDKNTDRSNNDSEEIIGRVTRRKRTGVLMSPDTQTPHRSSKSVNVLTDDESDDSFIIRPQKRKAKKILDMTNSIMVQEGDEDDDFEVKDVMSTRPIKFDREHRRNDALPNLGLDKKETANKNKKSSDHHHMAAYFLDEEAEVSDDAECSSDEDDTDLDNSSEGFINNASQCSQTICPEDMHAIYMKSVRTLSPPGPSNCFKMMHRRSPDINIFSQVPQQDASYMEDSFVVQGGNEEEYGLEKREDLSLGALDNTINLQNIIDGGSKRIGGRTLRNRGGESKAARILRAGRAALLKSDSSLSDVEEEEEDIDLMEWEIDFEESRKNQRKKQSNHQTSKKSRQLKDCSLVRKNKASSEPPRSDWMSKPKTGTQPFETNAKDVLRQEKEKSPLKSNYAVRNSRCIPSESIDSERHVSKPSTFIDPQPATSSTSTLLDSPTTLAQRKKEERLRRQKQKQAEFLQKMHQRQAQTSQASDISPVRKTALSSSSQSHQQQEGMDKLSTSKNPALFSASPGSVPKISLSNSEGLKVIGSSTSRGESNAIVNQCSGSSLLSSVPIVSASNKTNTTITTMESMMANSTMSATTMNSSVSSTQSSIGQVPLVILVDSKELSSAPHIVSTLTITYGLDPIVSQLQGCDYVTSTRMGVEKRTVSEFANGANRQKLLDRMRHMCELFDRPCLIIEKDREKNRDKGQPPKTLMRTKYLDSTLAALTKTHVKILFSDTTEETAQILADLVKMESRKGAAIPTIPDVDSTSEQMLKLYQSIPGVSYVTALSLMHHFSSVAELLSICESILQSRIKVSSVRAKQIMTYFNHCFDEQMTVRR